ncbi:hypothetical protein V2J09_003065 [Rumex salicifolius]
MPSRPISQNPKPTNSILKSQAFFIAITASATAVIICTLIYILYHFWQTLFQRSRTSPFDEIAPLKLHKFTYKEIKSATNGFNPENAIGKGGSGTVFRGVLRDGKSVAIKKLDPSATLQFEKEFQNELNILGSIKSPYVVSLLGYCIHKNKRILVYEYMPNRSLQELLFSEVNLGLSLVSWDRRFKIILDVCRALEFLHNECDPPVIHGDVKPSNVLLDWDFRAKISDFGLSRFKLDGGDQFGAEMFSQDFGKSQELLCNMSVETPVSGARTPVLSKESSSNPAKFDFGVALQASSSMNGRNDMVKEVDHSKCSASPKGKEILRIGVVEEIDSKNCCSVEECDISDSKQWGKDWWWKQDGSGELCSKDYVMEWIGSQISPKTNRQWGGGDDDDDDDDQGLDKPSIHPNEVIIKEKSHKKARDSGTKKEPKKMEDWWKEENLEDINNKKRKRLKRSYKPLHFHLSKCLCIRKSSKMNKRSCDQGEEQSSRRIWRKKKKNYSMNNNNSEVWSGDLFSRELSSTTSMRGTLCYVAPEFGGTGFGFLMEKTDIYSLGVLILVIVSGRRPLHVLNSPMKLEKANLISWSRQLAQSGSVLELVDEKLRGSYNKDQATLCINLALACLNRMPELRPDVGDIVRILKGEIDLPPLPFVLSPSPPCKLSSKVWSKT